jgi:cobalt-zinc-cadmium efflux system outer membrane protein
MRSFFAPLALAAMFSHAQAEAPRGPGPSPEPAGQQAEASTAAGPLSLRQALSLALKHNPDLAAARLEVEAMDGARLQAGARPNPQLEVLVEDTRRSTRTTTLQWSQPLEWGGKRSARLAGALNAREQSVVALASRQAELEAAVTGAFFEVLGAQEQVRLTEASLEVARHASEVATKRLQAGKIPPLEQTKAQLAEAGVRDDLSRAQSELSLARQRLSLFWGRGGVPFERAEGDADTLPGLPPDEHLAERLAQAPAIRLARLDIERRQALTAAERARRVPDLTLTLGAKRDAALGRTQAVMGVSVPLPLLDTNQGNLLEALRREDQSREALAATTLRVQGEAAQAVERLRMSRLQVQRLRSDVLPAAESAHAAAVKGYELGKFAFLEVLDAQRTLFQLRQQALRSTADAHRAAVELDRLIGPMAPQAGHLQESTR